MHRKIYLKMYNQISNYNVSFFRKILNTFSTSFMDKSRLALLKISIFSSCILMASFISVTSCGFPDPFQFNVPTSPDVTGYSDGDKIFFSINGEYITNELPDFSGFNIYIGDNNETAQIEKRLLYISDKNITPSLSINLNDTSFPTNLEFTGAFSFRLTAKAKEVDRNDEGVSGIEELIENKAAWTVAKQKNFYFLVQAVAGNKTSAFSETLKVGIPEVSTKTFNLGTTEKMTLGEETLDVTFVNTAAGQSVSFDVVASSRNPVVESVGIGPDENWLQRSLPQIGFAQTDQIYGQNYVFFIQLKKGSLITHYLKVRITQINASSVDTVIHSFIN